MRIEDKPYTIKTFCANILKYKISTFDPGEEFRIYCLTISGEDISVYFPSDCVTKMGEITKITLPYVDKKDERREAIFYAGRYETGLFLLFTTTTNEGFIKTIGNIIRRKRGISQMWIHPKQFEATRNYILKKTKNTNIIFFSAKRTPEDKIPSEIRPDYERTIVYHGIDGKEALEEMRYYYGVIPQNILYEIDYTKKIRISTEGVFALEPYEYDTITTFFKVLDLIIIEVLNLKRTTEKIKFEFREVKTEQKTLIVPIVESGRINLSNKKKLTVSDAETIVNSAKNYYFSLIDVAIEEGSLFFDATVIDESKEVVFNISASETDIILMPKQNWTFESFIQFYRLIAENIDQNATITLFSGAHG